MTLPTVWSEREPGGWHDCVYSAVLMAVAGGGYAFGATLNTDAEREAFERSQTLRAPEAGGNFTAADQATTNRYGIQLHPTSDLAGLLARPGLAIAVAGSNDRLPTRLRRWDPTFSGGHAATVVTLAPAGLLWLDPEAPMGYAGEPISAAELLAWWNKAGVRYVALGELAPMIVTLTLFPAPRKVAFAGGRTFVGYNATTLARAKQLAVGAGGSSAAADASVLIAPPPAWAPDGRALRISSGYFAGTYLGLGGLTLSPAPPPPPPDCSGPVEAAVAARDVAWQTALGKVRPS